MIPDYNMTDKIVPLIVGGVTVTALLILLAQMILRPETDTIFADKEMAGEDADAPYGLWSTLAWFAGLIAATYVLGFILALTGFLVSFLRVRAQAPWPKTLILTAAGIALMCVMAGALNRDFPPGLLQGVVDLPWPLK
jgi:Mn2+/Fe2+ NRAMP family transporter